MRPVIVPSSDSASNSDVNPFSSALHRAVEDAARPHGVTVSAGASTRTRRASATS